MEVQEGSSPDHTQTISRTETRVDQAEVERVAHQIGGFYGLDEERISKAGQTEVLLVDDETFDAKVEDYLREKLPDEFAKMEKEVGEGFDAVAKALGRDPEAIRQMRKSNLEKLRKGICRYGGICLAREEGAIVYIRASSPLDYGEILRHEMVHVLSDWGGAFGFQQEDGKYHDLNEAATVIIDLGEKLKIPPDKILEQINENKISLHYGELVKKLLALMVATQRSENLVGVRQLANFYFCQEEGVEPETNAIMLKFRIEGNAASELEPHVKSLLGTFY